MTLDNWGEPKRPPHKWYSYARILYHILLLWYIGYTKLSTQRCSMDINAKHSIAHSHAWDTGPYIHHSNLANCKFTLMLLVLISYTYTRQKIRSQNPPRIAIMAHVIYAEPSVNQRNVRLQRRTQLVVNHSQLNRAPENAIETMINLHSVYNRGSL